MNKRDIQLPRKLTQQLLHLAQQSPDSEVCGLVAAKDGIPCRCYPIRNADSQAETRFLLDAQQQIDAMRQMRDSGETLFAIYHSHPTAPAEPSDTDLAMVNYPDVLYLIISLNTQGVLEMRGFDLSDGVVEVRLSLLD